MELFKSPGSMVHLPYYKKLLLLLTNIPLLLLIKKNFWLGITTFTVSTMYHYKQVTTDRVHEIDHICFFDVIMNIVIFIYLLQDNFTQLMTYLPVALLMCSPYYFGLRKYYPELHSAWHLFAVIIIFQLFK